MCKGEAGKQRAAQPSDPPESLIPRVLNDCQHAQSPQMRSILELVKCRAEHQGNFLALWCQCLRPIFLVQEKELTIERVVRYVAAFAAYRDEDHENECNAFVEEFLKYLLVLVNAANKTVRFRACQLIAEVMTRLADDVEVSDELWEDVIESMKQRMQDKIPGVRVNAARALARLVNSGDENDSTIAIYRHSLETDRSADVRKMVILSIPAINTTIPQVVERTMDVSDVVRKAAYFVLGSKFPIAMLSIMQRAKVLERGLSDRVPTVQAECLNMLKTAWLNRDCDGDVIALLHYLDVETNEKVGESVLNELVNQGRIRTNEGEGLRQFLLPLTGDNPEIGEYEAQLMGAEQALYWRVLCTNLHTEAQAKGNEAATTGGAQSVLNAAAAADTNEALDSILPPTVASYVDLVTAHLKEGPHHRFAARQLLLLARVLDFTDSTNRKVAGALVKTLLLAETPDSQQEAPHEVDPEAFVGDGLSLGGDQDWAAAVAELAVKVFSEQGEFEKVLAEAVLKVGQPCRDGGAEVSQWLQCLSVISLLLERLMSLHQLTGCAIEGQEMVDALLLPAVKHIHPEVQKASLRCLGLFGQLATRPGSSIVRQLRISISRGVAIVQNMAIKALFDLVLCHGATSLDRVIGIDPDVGPVPEPRPPGVQVPPELTSENEEVTAIQKPLLELLVSLLDSETIFEEAEVDTATEDETARSLVAEGFAKLLLQSKLFKDIQSIEDVILAKLLHLYFNEDLEISPRLQQCLSVFFHNYSVLSAENKKCVARAFIPVMRTEWPGVYGNKGVASAMVSAKKRATQLSRFMLQLLQNPLLSTTQEQLPGEQGAGEGSGPQLGGDSNSPDSGQERLAISIAVEVKRLSAQSTAAAKAYVVALTRILASLEFRAFAQEEVKCMIQLLNFVMDVVATDKVLMKELKAMLARLKSMDATPEEGLSDEQLHILIDNLGLHSPVEEEQKEQFDTPTPKAPRKPPTPSKKPNAERTATSRKKKAAVVVESPVNVGITRSQRKSKSEALQRLSLSAAKQRIASDDDSDASSVDTSDTNEQDTSETDTVDDAIIDVSQPKSSSSMGSPQRDPAKITRCPTSTSKVALPTVANTPLKPARDSSDASSVESSDDDEQSPPPVRPRPSHQAVSPARASTNDITQKRVVIKNIKKEACRPRTRRQLSETRSEDSTINSQEFQTSNITVEDEANSANHAELATSTGVIELESSDSDPDFQRIPKRSVTKQSFTSVPKRQPARRTAWK